MLSDAGKCLRTQVADHISAVLLVTFGLSARLGKLSVDCMHLGLDRLVCQGMRTNRPRFASSSRVCLHQTQRILIAEFGLDAVRLK